MRALLSDGPAFFRLLHAAKYGERPSLLLPLAEQLADLAASTGWVGPGDCVVSVPDDPSRLAGRGFSITGILGETLRLRTGCAFRPDLVKRRRGAPSLAKLRGAGARRGHHDGLWGVGRLAEIPRGQPLVLVDDQITTGSTVSSVAQLLGLRGNPVLVLGLAASSAAPTEV